MSSYDGSGKHKEKKTFLKMFQGKYRHRYRQAYTGCPQAQLLLATFSTTDITISQIFL